jgi:hypothetical protein
MKGEVMKPQFAGPKPCSFVLAALLLGGMATLTHAAPAPRPAPPEKKEATFKIPAFNNTNWGKVLDWFTEETGVAIIRNHSPRGSFTYNGPPDREYTYHEVLATINGAAANNDVPFVLVRGERTFVILYSEEVVGGR